MTYSINTIAKWFVENNITSSENSYDGNLTLNKLIYFADAMNYAINNKQLVDEVPVGFANGPVYQSVYIDHRYRTLASINSDEAEISEETLKLLRIVKFAFGSYNPQYLSELTHEQTPWKNKEELCKKSFINPQLSFEDLTDDEKSDLIEIYNMYGDMNLDNYVIDRIGNNVFVYDINTNLNEDDYMELQQLKVEKDSIFIEKIGGELVYA
ncbi:Panacea domain-containing protein [Staphylococcus delphini]|uniref:Panacea domain-containing protein n=1 Tax=Staphylococcus delphini TaxID=53344 RepID=UPI000308ED00|nr:Panacea domain-containing protein [Staphylococcus delphini]